MTEMYSKEMLKKTGELVNREDGFYFRKDSKTKVIKLLKKINGSQFVEHNPSVYTIKRK